MTYDEASGIIQDLATAHPGDTYVKVASAVLKAQSGDRPGAITALQQLVIDNPSDSYVHQVLAGLLGCEKATHDDAWVHYKAALTHGPLLTPGYKAAAFYLAKKIEPTMAERVLEDTGTVERIAIRTRTVGFNRMFLLFLICAVTSFVVRAASGGLDFAIGLMIIATALAGWFAFTNFIVGCWKCFAAWVILIALPWYLLIAENSTSGKQTLVIVGLGALIAAAYALSKRGRDGASAPAERTAR
jgi:hypothetical protein